MGTLTDLPEEIVQLILKKLSHDEFLQFGSVYKISRTIYLANYRHLPDKLPMSLCLPRPVGVPLLFLSCEEGASSFDLISITDEANRIMVELPERVNTWYCGSCCGWLIAVDIFGEKNVQLLNPFTRDVLKLPPLSSFQSLIGCPVGQPDRAPIDQFWDMNKVILSATPERYPKDCTVMAIVGDDKLLSFCKLGDKKWINVRGSPYYVADVVYHDRNFFAVDYRGVTLSLEEDGNTNYKVKIIAEPPFGIPDRPFEHRRYLVASQGVLLQIERSMQAREKDHSADFYHETIGFNVFKLRKRTLPASLYADCCTTKGWVKELNAEYEWVEIKSLGDEMVFLGLNCSISLPARFYPNCRGNSIYFTDDEMDAHKINFRERNAVPDLRHDVGVYNMEDKTVPSSYERYSFYLQLV